MPDATERISIINEERKGQSRYRAIKTNKRFDSGSDHPINICFPAAKSANKTQAARQAKGRIRIGHRQTLTQRVGGPKARKRVKGKGI